MVTEEVRWWDSGLSAVGSECDMERESLLVLRGVSRASSGRRRAAYWERRVQRFSRLSMESLSRANEEGLRAGRTGGQAGAGAELVVGARCGDA